MTSLKNNIDYKTFRSNKYKKYCKENNIYLKQNLKREDLYNDYKKRFCKDNKLHIEVVAEKKDNLNNENYIMSNDEIVILNNNCMIELSKLEDNSIDCVITDPPYFIDKLDQKWSSSQVNNDIKNSHIKHLPKGMKFDKSQVKNLYDFYLDLSKLLFKKMKPGAYFLSFSSPRLYHAIAMSCEIAGFEIRDMINWTYTQSMPKGMSMSHIIKK